MTYARFQGYNQYKVYAKQRNRPMLACRKNGLSHSTCRLTTFESYAISESRTGRGESHTGLAAEPAEAHVGDVLGAGGTPASNNFPYSMCELCVDVCWATACAMALP